MTETVILNGSTPDWQAMGQAYAAFWRDAGVDLAFEDEPRDWLAENAAKEAGPAPFVPPVVQMPPPRPLGPAAASVVDVAEKKADWPQTLADFAPWWMTEPTLDAGAAAQRVPPRGDSGAELMVLVAQPEASDRERLLSGSEGALLDAIERAMGLLPGEAYRASALPRATPAADWAAIDAAGLGAVLRHHIALVAPKRVLILSRDVVTLLKPEEFSEEGTGFVAAGERPVPVMAAYPLGTMLSRPGFKRIFWSRWLAFALGN